MARDENPSQGASEKYRTPGVDGDEAVAVTSLGGVFMSELEWSRLGRSRNPVTELLGLVTEQLRSSLWSSDWTDGWSAGDTARFEWAGGLTIPDVLERLLPVVVDGELYGIPGLRLYERGESSASLQWLPIPPTRLHLTRLPVRDPNRPSAQAFLAAIAPESFASGQPAGQIS